MDVHMTSGSARDLDASSLGEESVESMVVEVVLELHIVYVEGRRPLEG